jgi:hypothetical protein
MNTILAIWNSGGKGKSSTILELANTILAQFPNYTPIYSSENITNLLIDFTLVIEINGKIIALESQGDPGTNLEERLKKIVNTYNPNLILCTCRTRGETVQAINNVAKKHSYDKIWTSTYNVAHSQKLVNTLKGEHLLDLILKLGLI